MSLTLVTCLYDVAGREGSSQRRTVADYLEAAGFVFGLEQNLVVFADPGQAAEIEAARSAAGHASRTRVVAEPLERLAACAELERIAGARRRNPVLNASPVKDTPLYIALTWSKFELLERAAELDPFASTHLAWIDLGLSSRPHPDDRVFDAPADLVRLLVLRPWAPAELADRAEYFSYLRGLVAGGYLSGDRDRMLTLCELFAAEARAALDAGFAPSEEQLLPLLPERRPGLFEFHHGDYGAALSNYMRPRGGGENLLMQLRSSRDAGLDEWGLAICRPLIASVRAGVFEDSGELRAELLDECFLAAWHGGDRELAREVARLYGEEAAADPRVRDAFLRDEVRVRSNFKLLEDPPREGPVAS